MSQLTLTTISNGDTPDASVLMTNLNTLKNRINLGMEADNIAAGAVDGSHINLGAYIFKQSKGADVASAGTTTLGNDGNFFDITGTTTITSITAKTAGTVVQLQFDGILTLTNGSNLKLGATMTTAANSTIALVSDGTNWYEIGRSPSLPAAGTSGNVLTSNGTSWASSAPEFSLAQSGAPSAVSSFTISSLVAGSRYRLMFCLKQNTSNGAITLRFNADSGANYGTGGTGPANGVGSVGQTSIDFGNYLGTNNPVIATYNILSSIDLMYDPANNNNIYCGIHSYIYVGTTSPYVVLSGGNYSGASTVASLTIASSAGTMTGAWYLYKLS